jgi:hypothetical protein
MDIQLMLKEGGNVVAEHESNDGIIEKIREQGDHMAELRRAINHVIENGDDAKVCFEHFFFFFSNIFFFSNCTKNETN